MKSVWLGALELKERNVYGGSSMVSARSMGNGAYVKGEGGLSDVLSAGRRKSAACPGCGASLVGGRWRCGGGTNSRGDRGRTRSCGRFCSMG